MTRNFQASCGSAPIVRSESAGHQLSRAEQSLARADASGDVHASLIVRLVADAHGVAPVELFHHSRSRAPIATTRQVAMYLVHVLLGRTLTEVGAFFGRDRTTVAHGCARIEDLRDDITFDTKLCALEEKIWSMIDQTASSVDAVYGIETIGAANDG